MIFNLSEIYKEKKNAIPEKDRKVLAFCLCGALPLLILSLIIAFAVLSPSNPESQNLAGTGKVGIADSGSGGSNDGSGSSNNDGSDYGSSSGGNDGSGSNGDSGNNDSGNSNDDSGNNGSGGSLTAVQEEFDAYLTSLFAAEVSCDTLTLHYMTADPASFDIKMDGVTWGPATLTEQKKADAELLTLYGELEAFSVEDLTKEQQLCYRLAESRALYASALSADENYCLYGSVFSPTIGIQAQIPVLLAEYSFDDRQDIEDYLSLLELLPEYFTSLLTLQKARIAFGIPLPSALARRVCEQCACIYEQGTDCFLLEIFEEKLQEFSDDVKTLSGEEKEAYIERHKLLVYDNYLPAYRLLADNLAACADDAAPVLGLSWYDGGKEYYETFAQAELGTSRPMEEYISMTEEQIENDIQNIYLLLAQESSLTASLNDLDSLLPSGTPEEFLTTLSSRMLADFPALSGGRDDFTVKYVQPALESFISPAFYLIPQVDGLAANTNTIYLNGAYMSSGDVLFTTLAHEGFPGHLYQTVWFYSTKPNPIREIYACSGYVEGWATYVEYMSYGYMGLSDSLANLLRYNASFSLGLYARIDMGVNYEGWLEADVASYMESFGLNTSSSQEIFYVMAEEPGNYLKYYLGYLEILKLKEAAQDAAGDDFSLMAFHENLLNLGPLPFSLLGEYLSQIYS